VARIPRMTPAELTPAAHDVYDAITGGRRAQGPQHFPLVDDEGTLNGPFNAFLLAPGAGAALQELGAAIRYRTSLTARQREIAILLVAARWQSAFERASHEAVGRAAGLSDPEVRALHAQDASAFDGDDGVCARTVLALLDGDLDDDAWHAAANALGTPKVFELTTLVGYYGTLALQLRVFRVDHSVNQE